MFEDFSNKTSDAPSAASQSTNTSAASSKFAAAEMEFILSALDRSQAVIQFDPSGNILTANDNFLAAMGYSLNEIQGKHHSMFAAPGFAETAEYQEFWDSLRQGTFQAAEYKRIGKGGMVGIWHETYTVNPGQYEGVYGNMPIYGLAAATEHISAEGGRRWARQRLDVNARNNQK